MPKTNLKRRDFHKLTMAAFGGMVAGGCVQSAKNGPPTAEAQGDQGKDEEKPEIFVDPALLLQEPHVCRGLNSCQGKGQGEENACAGQGACAGVKAHECATTNDCKGQGGCGGYPGQNTCKGKGHCAVPLSDKTWAIARKQFEHLMKDAEKKVGDAPAKG